METEGDKVYFCSDFNDFQDDMFCDDIEEIAGDEEIIAIVVRPRYGDELKKDSLKGKDDLGFPLHLTNKIITWEEAKPFFSYDSYDLHHSIYVWTKSYVILTCGHNSLSFIEKIPRNPIGY